MTHVVTENCIKCKHTECVDVCPVDCFRETPYMLVIDPDECIDCAVCISECPSNAIVAEEDVPIGQEQFIEFNRIMTPEGSSITRSKKPFLDADFWNGVSGKAAFLVSEQIAPNLSSSSSLPSPYSKLLSSPVLSDSEWEENLNSPDSEVRYLVASRRDFVLDSSRLHRGLRDGDMRVRRLYVNLGENRLSDSDVEMLLNDPEKSIRLAILNQHTVILSDRQFFRTLESTDRDEVLAALKKITIDRLPELLNHSSALVRSFAYGCELAHLSPAQIAKGLSDSESNVRYAITHRSDFSPSPVQLIALLEAESNEYRQGELCRTASAECIARVMESAHPRIINTLIYYLHRSLSKEQKIKALSMSDQQVALAVLRNFDSELPEKAVDIALCYESEEVRLAAIQLRGVDELTDEQIARCLDDPSDEIRALIVSYASLSEEQIEKACTDRSKMVRLTLVRRKDFIPNVKQLKRGLKDKCENVRQGFADRFKICKGKVTGIASRGMWRVLSDLAGISTWTKEKYRLQSELLSLIDELDYFEFAVDARRAWFTCFGEHGIIDVPINQRGSLKDMRGKKIHLICIGSGRHSTVCFAAKPIDQADSKVTVTR